MSGGYAERLTKGVDYGTCGTPEKIDNQRVLAYRVEKLAQLIKNSKYIVAHTGAGISTSAGIPDFRGPKGIWTLEKQGKKIPKKLDTPWENVKPTLAHMALVALYNTGKLKFIISQNVDSLHIRSGFPRHLIAELHGNVFKECCPKCETEYFQPFDVQGIGLKKTGRLCPQPNCNEPLIDDLLDWNDPLEDEALELAEKHCRKADLSLCLGTSLRVQPASELPIITATHGGQVCIINLQTTEKDSSCSVRIFGKCDEVIEMLFKKLALEIPEYNPLNDFVVQRNTLQFALKEVTKFRDTQDIPPDPKAPQKLEDQQEGKKTKTRDYDSEETTEKKQKR